MAFSPTMVKMVENAKKKLAAKAAKAPPQKSKPKKVKTKPARRRRGTGAAKKRIFKAVRRRVSGRMGRSRK
jgi:hypothetical protein